MTYNRDDGSHPNDNNAASTSLLEYNATAITTITRSGGGTFDLNKIDLAPYGVNRSGPPFTVLFTGVRSDLSTVTQSLTVQNAYTTGGRPLLQTGVFSGFTGLTSVFMTQGAYGESTAYQFNNLVVDETSTPTPVPDPDSTFVLLGTGLLGLARFRHRVGSRR
jgi:hypothetical protein